MNKETVKDVRKEHKEKPELKTISLLACMNSTSIAN
ncbi:hypothetical protein LACR_2458 [Lactococcus cremoris subsp. cremoris SK11]|mgnify:FL=1|uniref:Uncharacterized protein n=1 Tax=Lactococcus lactis subsp. cremoris (strain SK11) TaxID=272622 RepID=Q02VX5_LACLS|nr:hypothetical protein LACR_2458 [Lactococcus cremoris subsp. cremoris SK11]